ncbi:site-specific tyrosine recombinase XerC-family [Enterococcus sp. AZ177]
MATIKQYKKKDGSKLWMFQTYLGINQATGKEIRTTRRGFGTKKEAQLELNRLLVNLEKNGLEKNNNETFKEIFELWFESYSTTVKEVTLLKNEIKFKKWILPVYGEMRIKEVTVKHAQKIVNKWARKTDQYRVLHSSAGRIFNYAMNLGTIDRNPLERVIMLSVRNQIKKRLRYILKWN